LIRFSIFALRCKQFKTAVIFSIQTSMLGWPTLFERRRRTVLGASMMAVNGRIQRKGEVVLLNCVTISPSFAFRHDPSLISI
jgi:hypothetical protein